MVEGFNNIKPILEKYNSLVGELEDIQLRETTVVGTEYGEEVESTLLVATNGTSITFTDNQMAIFTSGTHTNNVDEFNLQDQYIHRSKTLIMVHALLLAIGFPEELKKELLEEMFVDHSGFWLETSTTREQLDVAVLPQNNLLQIYIKLNS